MMDDTRKYLKSLDLPDHDLWELPTSNKRFPDGSQFRIEVPTVNTVEALQALLITADEYCFTVNRIDETYGIMRHTDKQIEQFIELAKKHKFELNFSVGPRATYDTSASVKTPQGARIGYRLRGIEQLIRGLEDVKRAVELGIRGILVYDEGMLWVLGKMREDGKLPQDVHIKYSAHCGLGNPAAAKVIESLGADSINPVRDLTLPMIAALRNAINVPLDVHTDNPPASGGFIRTYEAPEMVRIGAPIHLKCGNSAISGHGLPTGAKEGARMGIQAALVVRSIKKYYPNAIQSTAGAKGLAIPK